MEDQAFLRSKPLLECSCGDRSRPHINHRKTIPCWTYVGHDRFDIDADGRIPRAR